MGLTAHDMSDMGRLAQFAANPQMGASRTEIYLAVASLYRVQGGRLDARERALMGDILRRLTKDVEMAIRIALAQRLADDIHAPHDLILLLVDDTIDVARPLILSSPLFSEKDALELIARASAPHLEAVAGRPNIGAAVTEALTESDCETVLLALLRNATARISDRSYVRLVEKSRALVALQEPLVRRADLPARLAATMCGFVSESVKRFIENNYAAAGVLEAALADATASLVREPERPSDPPAGSAHKLIDKLAASGQLKAGFLMRVLSQGQMDLFDLGFSHLLETDIVHFRRFFYEDGVRPVALACRAVGIDKSAFNTVFSLSRRGRGMVPVLQKLEMAEIDAIFRGFAKPAALQALKSATLS